MFSGPINIASTLRYELKEYPNEIIQKFVWNDSCVALGKNLPKLILIGVMVKT